MDECSYHGPASSSHVMGDPIQTIVGAGALGKKQTPVPLGGTIGPSGRGHGLEIRPPKPLYGPPGRDQFDVFGSVMVPLGGALIVYQVGVRPEHERPPQAQLLHDFKTHNAKLDARWRRDRTPSDAARDSPCRRRQGIGYPLSQLRRYLASVRMGHDIDRFSGGVQIYGLNGDVLNRLFNAVSQRE